MRNALFLLLFGAKLALAADPLQTVKAEYREVPLRYTAEGLVEAVKQSTVSAQISGRVSAVNFDVGDHVKKGQVIVKIDASEAEQSFNESRAMLAQAEAAFGNASANYRRSQHLFEQKFVSQAALDRAKAEYDTAKAQVDARQANVSIARTTKSYASIVAPFSGVVMARHVELGEMASPGKPIMTGFDPANLRVTVNVPQFKLAAVESGKSARIQLPVLGKTIAAKSMIVLPAANALTHTTQVRLDLPENTPGIYPGMFAEAVFDTGRAKKLLIPAASVVRRSEVTAVYVVAGNQISLRQVRLGEMSDDEIEVLSGLAAGETVAVDPVKAGIVMRSGR